jgi:aspartyl-tRNA synthetase
MQISNISDILPPHRRISLNSRQEILECLVVRQIADSNFIGASQACRPDSTLVSFCLHQSEEGSSTSSIHQERIVFTNENRTTWLLACDAMRDSSPRPTPDDVNHINTALSLRPGDQLWLARRSRAPSVCLSYNALFYALNLI